MKTRNSILIFSGILLLIGILLMIPFNWNNEEDPPVGLFDEKTGVKIKRDYVVNSIYGTNVLLDQEWSRVRFDGPARIRGSLFKFLNPDSSDYVEIRIEGSDRIIKIRSSDMSKKIDYGNPTFMLVRGNGDLFFKVREQTKTLGIYYRGFFLFLIFVKLRNQVYL